MAAALHELPAESYRHAAGHLAANRPGLMLLLGLLTQPRYGQADAAQPALVQAARYELPNCRRPADVALRLVLRRQH